MNGLPVHDWPYLQTILRLLLALGLGLFVGLERERRGKEAGLRTFSFVTVVGALGGLLGESYALLSIVLIGILIIILNIGTLMDGKGTEITTSVAILLMGLSGILCGQGHTLIPAAVAIMAAALLASKRLLSKFTVALTETELRSAILLAILAFVIYPALPRGAIDPWGAIEPRVAWITVILIAGISFVNYILWKIFGRRGMEVASFFGGLVNSSVTVNDLVERVKKSSSQFYDVAFPSIMFAIGAMIIRNVILLAILAKSILFDALLPLALMILTCGGWAFSFFIKQHDTADADISDLDLEVPFSLSFTLKFGLFFLALQVAGILGQNLLGQSGIYAVSFLGGLFSSTSAIAAATSILHKGTITVQIGTIAVILATMASVLIKLPLIIRARNSKLTRQLIWVTATIIIAGAAGLFLQITLF